MEAEVHGADGRPPLLLWDTADSFLDGAWLSRLGVEACWCWIPELAELNETSIESRVVSWADEDGLESRELDRL